MNKKRKDTGCEKKIVKEWIISRRITSAKKKIVREPEIVGNEKSTQRSSS